MSARVVAWLDADESDFVDANGDRAALWRVRYDEKDGALLGGDAEDLEEVGENGREDFAIAESTA